MSKRNNTSVSDNCSKQLAFLAKEVNYVTSRVGENGAVYNVRAFIEQGDYPGDSFSKLRQWIVNYMHAFKPTLHGTYFGSIKNNADLGIWEIEGFRFNSQLMS